MRSIYFALIGASLVAACGQKKTTVAQDSTSRDIQLTTPDSTVALNDAPAVKPEATKTDTVYLPQPTPPAPPPPAPRVTPPKRNPPVSHPAPSPSNPPSTPPSPAPLPAPPPAAALVVSTLTAGTVLETNSTVALTSRHNKAGETFTATLSDPVTSSTGKVVIPAGAAVTFTIVALKPAENKSQADGVITLRATSVMVNGESRPIDADVTYVEHTLKGRGIGTSEAAKVGVGAAAGAILGRVIGGSGGATAAGGVVGGAAGAAVAVETADRDVVIAVGAKIRLTLRSTFGGN